MSAPDITGHFSNPLVCDDMRPSETNAGECYVMGHILPLVFSLLVSWSILQTGFKGLFTLDELSKKTTLLWRQEYELRRCILREAASKNISVASQILVRDFPDQQSRVAAEERLIRDQLELFYPETTQILFARENNCCTANETLCFALDLESHSGQSTPWPNYVPRISKYEYRPDL